jgi:hypothetical protein
VSSRPETGFHDGVIGMDAGATGPRLMAWFRTNRGIAAWLAFFALAYQLS